MISTQAHAGTAYTKGTDTALHAINSNGPIKAGDLILLRSGDHGSPTIFNMFNTDFVTVAAAPGATPIIGKMAVVSSAKWMFQGLTFQGVASATTGANAVKTPTTSLVASGVGDWQGATSDVVFDSDNFQSASSTTGWTDADWLSNPHNLSLRIGSTCTSVSSSHFTNFLNGIFISGEKSLIFNNGFDHFSNDAMDVAASNVLIKQNTVKDGLNTKIDPYHPDGIQGWSLVSNGVTATNTNVVVDGNSFLKAGDASVSYMQGISFFTGKWKGLVIQNNVVVVNVWDALSVYGAQDSKIINNTVIASDPTGHPSWIQVHNAGDGTQSSNVLVRNNIATSFDLAPGAVYDHNIASKFFALNPDGKRTFTNSIGFANVVLPAVLDGFMSLDTASGTFDLRLRSTSKAVGFGAGTSAPLVDILGKSRKTPVDLGAYVH